MMGKREGTIAIPVSMRKTVIQDSVSEVNTR